MRLFLTFLLLWSVAPGTMAYASTLAQKVDEITSLYQKFAPAVVRVKVATEDYDEEGMPRVSLLVFSGFFISSDGLVLTNSTASARSNRIWIEKDGLSFLAEPVGSDPRTNVGLLQVIRLPRNLVYVSLDEIPESPPPIGAWVLAITSPLDFAPTPTVGLVTGYESQFANFNFPFTYIRTNIPGGPAEGGSPVFDNSGRLVGISVASVPEVRSSYLIPARVLHRFVRDFKSHGKVIYGQIPVEFIERPDRNNTRLHVTVNHVVPNSTAATAGLQPGDILQRIDTTPVDSLNALRDYLFDAPIGSFLPLVVIRDGETLTFNVRVERRPDLPIPDPRTLPRPPSQEAPLRPGPEAETPSPPLRLQDLQPSPLP